MGNKNSATLYSIVNQTLFCHCVANILKRRGDRSSVIASLSRARQSSQRKFHFLLDCHVVATPRNDGRMRLPRRKALLAMTDTGYFGTIHSSHFHSPFSHAHESVAVSQESHFSTLRSHDRSPSHTAKRTERLNARPTTFPVV